MSRTGYKGLPQKSVLSLFLYSILGSGVDRFIPAGCGIHQYADNVEVYASHRIKEIAGALAQTACSALKVLFVMVGLRISAVNSEAIVFSRKHQKPDVTLWIDGRRLPQAKEFKHLGVCSDSGLRWSTQVRYVQKQCLNFMRSTAATWWGAHPKCMLLLYKGMVGSILDYASVICSRMARMHFLKLERLQYLGLRIALGLMQSTPNNSLLSGVSLLAIDI
jgi:hypothetical protein